MGTFKDVVKELEDSRVGYDVPASVLAQFPELHKSPSVASSGPPPGDYSSRGTNYMQVLGEAGWPSAQNKTTTTVTGPSTPVPQSAAPNQGYSYPNWGCCPCCGRPYGYWYPPYPTYPSWPYPMWVNTMANAGGCAPGPVPGSTWNINAAGACNPVTYAVH